MYNNIINDIYESDSPHLKIFDKNFKTFQQYKYNTTIYKKSNKNRILYDHFQKNNLIGQFKCSKNNPSLHKKLIKEYLRDKDRIDRKDNKESFLKKMKDIEIDEGFLNREIIDDHFILKYHEDLKQNMMALFFLESYEDFGSCQNGNFFLCFNDGNNRRIKFYEVGYKIEDGKNVVKIENSALR